MVDPKQPTPRLGRNAASCWTRAMTAVLGLAGLAAAPVLGFLGLLGAWCLGRGSECAGLPVVGQVIYGVGILGCLLVAVTGVSYAVRPNATAGRVFGWACVFAVSPIVYTIIYGVTR